MASYVAMGIKIGKDGEPKTAQFLSPNVESRDIIHTDTDEHRIIAIEKLRKGLIFCPLGGAHHLPSGRDKGNNHVLLSPKLAEREIRPLQGRQAKIRRLLPNPQFRVIRHDGVTLERYIHGRERPERYPKRRYHLPEPTAKRERKRRYGTS